MLKCARMQCFPIDLNLGFPFVVSFAPGDAFVVRCIIFLFSSVTTVLMRIGVPQVLPAVIIGNVVPVVYFAVGPFASHVEPCQLMGVVVAPIDLDSAGAITTN